MVQVTFTKMAAMPIYMYVKTFKNLLSLNQKSFDPETWHATSGTQVLQSLYKGYPGLTLSYFTARSNLVTFGSLYFSFGPLRSVEMF